MATIHEYAPGTPCWFELGTTDQAAAKDFYGHLFGWVPDDQPVGGEFYTLFQLQGRTAAAAYTLSPKVVSAGVGAHWNVYLSAANVDASAAKVTELGGTVLQPPFDVMDAGRMVNCKDPEGAQFTLWQGKRTVGAGALYENGAVVWTELATRDTARARDFYSALLGWSTKSSALMETYIEFSAGERPRGGLLPMGDEWGDAPPRWAVYFMVEDCDATLEQAKQRGATTCFGPISMPGVGRFAALMDPQGAFFYVITPKPL